MKVAAGQVWRHKPSGDIRTCAGILPYEARAGMPPTDFEKQYGITHIAVMGNDRRDSSDMELGPEGEPFHRRSWEHLPAGDTNSVAR